MKNYSLSNGCVWVQHCNHLDDVLSRYAAIRIPWRQPQPSKVHFINGMIKYWLESQTRNLPKYNFLIEHEIYGQYSITEHRLSASRTLTLKLISTNLIKLGSVIPVKVEEASWEISTLVGPASLADYFALLMKFIFHSYTLDQQKLLMNIYHVFSLHWTVLISWLVFCSFVADTLINFVFQSKLSFSLGFVGTMHMHSNILTISCFTMQSSDVRTEPPIKRYLCEVL